MNKRVKQPKKAETVSPTRFNQFLQTYPAVNLEAALSSFENTLGWELMQAYIAYIQREFESDALDLVVENNMVQRAAFASGYAKACEDIPVNFITGLRQAVSGRNPVTELSRPEE